MLNKKLLGILACPVCKLNLEYNKKQLKCNKCKKNYKIKNNIPMFINATVA